MTRAFSEHSEYDHTLARNAGRAAAVFLGADEGVAPAVAERHRQVHEHSLIAGSRRVRVRLAAPGSEQSRFGASVSGVPVGGGSAALCRGTGQADAEVAMLMRGEDTFYDALPADPNTWSR